MADDGSGPRALREVEAIRDEYIDVEVESSEKADWSPIALGTIYKLAGAKKGTPSRHL